MSSFDRFDFFVAGPAAANPTWPTGDGGSVVGAPTPASALTKAGTRVVLHSIQVLSGTGGGSFILAHGNGVTNYLGAGVFFPSGSGTFRNVLNMELSDGLALDTALLTGVSLLCIFHKVQ